MRYRRHRTWKEIDYMLWHDVVSSWFIWRYVAYGIPAITVVITVMMAWLNSSVR